MISKTNHLIDILVDMLILLKKPTKLNTLIQKFMLPSHEA